MRGRRETQAAETTAEMKASNEALLKSYDNDPKALEVDIENMRRTFQNHAGLTAEEFEQIADDLMGPDKDGKAGAILRSPVLARALLKLLAPMSKEGTGEQGKGGTPLKAGATPKEQLPKTAEALGW